jgi:LmbE family N-acetylglucosaminyl deacetylase
MESVQGAYANGKKSILVFGAHPDDIEIGMGGTIAKLPKREYDVILVIMTLPHFTEIDKKEQRRQEAVMSAKVMGVKAPIFLDLAPEDVTFSRNLVGKIDALISKYRPVAVFTQWIGDSHQDHYVLTKSVMAAARDVADVFMYETTIPGGITEKPFRPQLFVDIKDFIGSKKDALNMFESQKIRGGHLWVDAVISRCAFRGYQANTNYAEAFEVIKVTKW